MRPRERRETGEQDLFRSRLDQIIDLNHPLAKLARTVDWRFLEGRFGEAYTDDPGHPPLPTRLMAGLAILKHTYDLSDEVLCERWVENPYYLERLRRRDFPAPPGARSLVRRYPPSRRRDSASSSWAFAKATSRPRPTALGSSRSNLGHRAKALA